jgi:hypothetical protein
MAQSRKKKDGCQLSIGLASSDIEREGLKGEEEMPIDNTT